jgi:glutaredoxin
MSSLKAIHVVHMQGCPHCVVAIQKLREAQQRFGIPLMLHDVNSGEAGLADDMVRMHGDWSEDYIVPQVFFETDGEMILHALTGYPEGVQFTERAIDNLLDSEFFRRLAQVELMSSHD